VENSTDTFLFSNELEDLKIGGNLWLIGDYKDKKNTFKAKCFLKNGILNPPNLLQITAALLPERGVRSWRGRETCTE
jgi:hypothetical protein